MSLVPLLVNLAREFDTDYAPAFNEWDHYLDDDFGFGIHPLDLIRPTRSGNYAALRMPRRRGSPYDRQSALMRRDTRSNKLSETGIMPTVTKDGFQVCMDVSQFKPNELTVKTVDRTVIVEGKHEEREDDHGLIQRHFVRKYTLPKDYDPKEVVSTISTDGVLTVKAPPPPNKAIKQNERIVQIQHTGPAHMSVKAPEAGDAGKGGKNHNGAPEKMQTTK